MRTIQFCAMSLPLMLLAALPAQAQSRMVNYECQGGRSFQAEYMMQPNQARLTLGTAQPMTLTQVPSADGARYSDGNTTLFTKGNDAFVEENGKTTYSNCVAQASPGTEQQSTSSTSSTSTEQTAGQPAGEQSTMGESSASGPLTSQSSSQQTGSQQTVIRRSTTTQQQTVIRRSTPAPTAQTPPQQTAAPAEQPAPQALW